MKNSKIKLISLFIPLLLLFVCCGLFLSFTPAKAESVFDKAIALPTEKSEVFDFEDSNPTDALFFGKNKAIIRSDNTLWISVNGEDFIKYDKLKYNNPGQIKALDENTLFVSDDTALFSINVNNLDDEPKEINYSGNGILVKYFDLNRNYLVTISNQTLSLYQITNGEISVKIDPKPNAKDQTPVCVDENGKVYFIQNSVSSQSELCCYDSVTNTTGNPLYTTSGKITHLIANTSTVYFTEGSLVKSINVYTGEETTFNSVKDDNYDLGAIVAPMGISFSGNKLLISDSTLNAVQEFAIEEDNLAFTGNAVAQNQTAFNRAGVNVRDVEYYDDKVALLTDKKVMVVNYHENFDPTDKTDFINLFASDLGGVPQFFALGKDSLLIASNASTPYVGIYNLKKSESPLTLVELSNSEVTLRDVCYQSGYYYILATSSSSIITYKIDPRTCTEVGNVVDNSGWQTTPQFTVDVFGNARIFADNSIIKVASDLVGNVYAIKADGFYKYDGERFNLVYSQTGLKSFAMNFDNQRVYTVYDGDEFIYQTTSLDNLAIDGTLVPSDFVKTGENANQTFNLYTPLEGENLYAVTTLQGAFNFDDLAQHEKEYVVLCELDDISHYLLAGQKGLYLAYANQDRLTPISEVTNALDKTVYVTTDVNAYYLPIMTRDSDYAITVQSEKIRLQKGTTLKISGLVDFLDRNFYVCTFNLNDTVHTAYVPALFTTDKLSEDIFFTSFTIQTTDKVVVYSDNQLKDKIFNLSDGDTVRLIETKDGVCRIQYFDGESWNDGFISADAIKPTPNTTIRNVLLILAVCASLCGTITYFLIRKKKD